MATKYGVLTLLYFQRGLAQYSLSQSGVVGATPTSGAPAITSTVALGVDDLWNLWVGPVSTAEINTTVQATPVPSSSLIPPPPLYYPSFPTGQQVPLVTKNESWSFPDDFLWGVASAAYQVEGAARDEGRGPSLWDALTHRIPGYVTDNSTGDVADNQYYLYKQDIARIAALGVPSYSFSISWPRIFPFGSGQVNEAGLAHYEDVINTCFEYGVDPIVTLFHWDLPLYLQNTYGGWLDEQVVEDFTNYAETVFKRYGNRIRHWFTLNEPIVFCRRDYPLPDGYFRATDIPAKQQPYFCGHHALLAHAGAYAAARRVGINGTISFKNNGGHHIPSTNDEADLQATQRAWDFEEGWFATPTFLTGDYPPALKSYVSTFLPDFTPDQKSAILNSSDIFAYDAYTAQFHFAPDDGIAGCVANTSNALYPQCYNTTYTYPEAEGGWLIGPSADAGATWLHKTSDWVPALLRYVQDTWKPAGGIAVTEFGFAEPFEQLRTLKQDILSDFVRSAYYDDYINGILIAIADGVIMVGCFGWSLVDNLEWRQGFNARFGMQYVNFTTQERYYKASFFHFVNKFNTYLPSANGTA